jgi:TPR repeat protein
MEIKALAYQIAEVDTMNDWDAVNKIAAILREAFPEKPEPAKDAQTIAELLAAHGYIQECDVARVAHVLSLTRPEPSSGEPHLPWRDSLEIAIAECTKLQRYLASESAVRREAQARAENAEAAWEAAVEQIKIEQGMKEKAEGETKALREALAWISQVNAMDYEYQAHARAALATKEGTARNSDGTPYHGISDGIAKQAGEGGTL